MADTFFPACLGRINNNRVLTFLYHDVIFPESVAEECPEYTLTLYSTDGETATIIRQPFLLLAALWGAWIGIDGFLRLWRRPAAGEIRTTSWAVALLAFGMMNVSAVFVHCLWPAPTTDYPTDYPLFWVVDTYMTGVSGSCLLVASLEEIQARWKSLSYIIIDDGGGALTYPLLLQIIQGIPIQEIAMGIQLVGVLCIGWFATSPAPQLVAASHPLELWYLVPIVMAGVPVLLVVYENVWMHLYKTVYLPWQKGELSSPPKLKMVPFSVGQAVFASSIFVAGVLGIVLDRVWCSPIGYSLARDFLSANTFVFLGCDLAFWGLVRFLYYEKRRQPTSDDGAGPYSNEKKRA